MSSCPWMNDWMEEIVVHTHFETRWGLEAYIPVILHWVAKKVSFDPNSLAHACSPSERGEGSAKISGMHSSSPCFSFAPRVVTMGGPDRGQAEICARGVGQNGPACHSKVMKSVVGALSRWRHEQLPNSQIFSQLMFQLGLPPSLPRMWVSSSHQ